MEKLILLRGKISEAIILNLAPDTIPSYFLNLTAPTFSGAFIDYRLIKSSLHKLEKQIEFLT